MYEIPQVTELFNGFVDMLLLRPQHEYPVPTSYMVGVISGVVAQLLMLALAVSLINEIHNWRKVMEEIKLPAGWLKAAMQESEESWRKVPLWLKSLLGNQARPAALQLSDTVYIRLTDYGKAVYRAEFKGEPEVDKFGYTGMPLHEAVDYLAGGSQCVDDEWHVLLEPMVDTTPEMS